MHDRTTPTDEGAIGMTDEKKPDYSKIKTPGGVTTTADGDTHPTALTDESRAARVQALKNERAAIAGRADLEGDSGTVAKRRLGEIDRQLASFGGRQERRPDTPAEKAVPPKQ